MTFKETNALLKLLFDASPHDFQSPKQMTTEMKMAMAQAYAIEGFRKYLEHALDKFILNSALRTDNMEALMVRRGRILTLKELLEVGKSCYQDYNKLKDLANKDATQKRKK
jgi:hypothetical protein